MAPLPVIANCFRVTANWQSGDGLLAAANVLHFVAPSLSSEDVLDALNSNQSDIEPCFTPLPSVWAMHRWDVIELDGSSGTVSSPVVGFTGAASGSAAPACAVVASHKTGIRGPSGRGRTFIGPMGEDVMQNGIFNGANVTLEGAWTNMREQMALAGLIFVVASYHLAVARTVQSTTIKLPLGTVRRRQAQVG